MPSPKPTRFQRSDQARADQLGARPADSDGPSLALDVDGQVTKDQGRPQTVVVYGASYAFVLEGDSAKVVIAGRTYRLSQLDGREVLFPEDGPLG